MKSVSVSSDKSERVEDCLEFLDRFKDDNGKVNCTSLRKGFAAFEKDAQRYRFLRTLHDPGPADPRVHTLDQQHDPVQVRLCFGDDLDAAVDAAMERP